jgi:nucleoside diphosphate kinase
VATRNCAFVYLKPHANCSRMKKYLRDFLVGKGFKLTLEGSFDGQKMLSGAVVDKQFSDVARRAMLLKPHELSLPSSSYIRFQKKFGLSWSDAVEDGLLYNAADIIEKMGVSADALCLAWLDSVSNGKMVKLGRGFYCSLIDTIPDKPAVFCINGFYAAMRAEYLAAGASVHYFVVEWDNEAMSWDEFRKKVVGSTNPSLAHPDSLRSIMSADWEGLGLESPMNMMRNGVHASASAFEAMVERSIWLGTAVDTDKYLGAQLLSASIPVGVLEDWSGNPIVHGKFMFDHMENQGTHQCLHIAKNLYNIPSSGMSDAHKFIHLSDFTYLITVIS